MCEYLRLAIFKCCWSPIGNVIRLGPHHLSMGYWRWGMAMMLMWWGKKLVAVGAVGTSAGHCLRQPLVAF